MKSKAYKRAEKMALKSLKDWRRWAQCANLAEASTSLNELIIEAVGYGYQAATVDMDEYNRGEQCRK